MYNVPMLPLSNRGILILTALFLVAALPFAGNPVVPGLDPSYIFALNWMMATGQPAADDLLFTYGPLGFLSFPQPLGHNLLLGNLLRGLVAAAFAFTFFQLCLGSGVGPRSARWRAALSLAGALVGANLVLHLPFCYTLFALTLTALMARRSRGKPMVLTAAYLAPALAFVIKPAFWIISTLLLLSVGACRSWRDRRAGPLVAAAAWSSLALAAFWLAAGGSLPGLARQLRAQWELAAGNSGAMTYPANIHWEWLVPACLMLAAALLLLRPGRALLVGLVLPAMAWARYALGRPDHALHLHHLALLIGVLFLAEAAVRGRGAPAPRRWWGALVMVAASLAGLQLGLADQAATFKQRISPARLLWQAVQPTGLQHTGKRLSPGREARRLQKVAAPVLAKARLGQRLRQRLAGQTVDVYPWNLALVHANGLTWTPRPVLQSYLSYTPWLDAQNAAHLAGPRAPRFILWEVAKPQGPVLSIDLRYLFSDEPRTMLELVRRYRLCDAGKRAALLVRRQQPLELEHKVLGRQIIRWNSWVPVPRASDGIVRARLKHGLSLRGMVLHAVSQDRFILMRYRFSDGAVRTHRVVPGSAESGLWISPYLDHHFFDPPAAGATPGQDCPLTRAWHQGNRPTAIRLVPSDMRAVAPALSITWEKIRPR